MKINERYLWIAGVILVGFAFQSKLNQNDTLKTLLQTYEVETNIQNAQINDFGSQLAVIRAESYSQGFEEGRTQAGIALVRGGSLYDYADGYHAAIGQNIEEADVLEISEGIMNELTSLRKMVPRLLNQLNSQKNSVDFSASELELLDFLLEGNNSSRDLIEDELSNKSQLSVDQVGFYFKEGWELRPPFTDEMAKDFLKKIFNLGPPVEESPTSSHIGQYINDLMYSQGYDHIALEIEKDEDGDLVFSITHKK